jgi:hypothetical protein
VLKVALWVFLMVGAFFVLFGPGTFPALRAAAADAVDL